MDAGSYGVGRPLQEPNPPATLKATFYEQGIKKRLNPRPLSTLRSLCVDPQPKGGDAPSISSSSSSLLSTNSIRHDSSQNYLPFTGGDRNLHQMFPAARALSKSFLAGEQNRKRNSIETK
mmetsp:Transcript_24977/g.59370  ORF Transcript_24977/g.59370 Transcript_24977/m.59370 type:complete len:120 (-) Transcript_24977:5-364(-)